MYLVLTRPSYAKGLRKQVAEALVSARISECAFCSADDLAQRVLSLAQTDLTRLAEIGALNGIDGIRHRLDALWQVGRAGKQEGPLLWEYRESLYEDSCMLPLEQMDTAERLEHFHHSCTQLRVSLNQALALSADIC